MRFGRLNPIALVLFVLVAVQVVAMALLSSGREPVLETLLFGFQSLAWASAGVLVVSQQPRNPVGWAFCGSGLFGALSNLAEGWSLAAADLGLPGGVTGEWIAAWSWIPDGTLLTLVLLLFPDGRLLSPRWRPAVWLALCGCALAVAGYALSPSAGAVFTGGRNPYAMDGTAFGLLFGVGNAVFVTALVVAVCSFSLRLRRARGVERQQLKWFAYAAVLLAAVAPFGVSFWGRSSLVELPFALALATVPVGAAIGLLRYRLYDIDVLINRTLVYGVLTALLTLVYTTGVFVLGTLFSPGEGDSQLAVAAATLAAAALFQPARRRVQAIVDRRFNRDRYDAALTVQAFSTRLRDEVDLDTLAAELLTVLTRTMQPAAAALWLRPGAESARGGRHRVAGGGGDALDAQGVAAG